MSSGHIPTMVKRSYKHMYGGKKDTPSGEHNYHSHHNDRNRQPDGQYRQGRSQRGPLGRVDRRQHLDVHDPLGRGKETDDQTRALKLIRGLRHDVYEFSRLLAMRAGAIPVIAVYQPWSDADAG